MRTIVVLTVMAAALLLVSQPVPVEVPGPGSDGATMLVTGWRIQPAGRQIPLDTLPMSSLLTPDKKFVLVGHGGYTQPVLSVLDARTLREVHRHPLIDGWLGMALSPNGRLLYIGGGPKASVYEYTLTPEGRIENPRTFELVPPTERKPDDFAGDVALSPDGRMVYVADLFHDQILIVNPQSGRVIERAKTGRRPYRILFHPDGKSFFVSSWADAAVHHHRTEDGLALGSIRVGSHPTDMVWRDKKTGAEEAEGAQWRGRLFIAAANTNQVYVVGVTDSKDLRLIETINVALTPRQPLGVTPSGLALSHDQNRLFIACSGTNAVAVADVSSAKSVVEGFLPVGWYPTGARALEDGRLLVLNGKGARSYPNPQGPNPSRKAAPSQQGNDFVQYVGRLQTGSLSVIDPFDDARLQAYTRQVTRLAPYNDRMLDAVNTGAGSPVPGARNTKSPIEHVIYIVKENRTYDQVLGDLGRGNGDPSLTLFTEQSSPNHHKLAREFTLLDNFYVNADVSADGHNWSAAAISPDFVEKMWPLCYGGRRRPCGYAAPEPAALPPAGYIWSNALSRGLTVRNYGWWVTNTPKGAAAGPQVETVRDPQLRPVTNLDFRGFDVDHPDIQRAQVFLADFQRMTENNNIPRLMLIRLGNDHTSGTAAGKIGPLSAMADNDYALGMIVDAVSRSKVWPRTAIFVLEDDAQNGPDHVDSHRAPAYILSPYTRGSRIDSTMYNTTSMLRTIELILGMSPMTTFDAASRPMSNAFNAGQDLRPYDAEKPRIPLDQRNPTQTALARRAEALDLSEADRIDDDEMNEILWRAIRGTDPPAPVRSYFAR
ncbi:MAG: hypothetical protein FJW40_16645 [Acidobacteria bacterium]|nr:hypothetical protein [Acidobacteriota bacterium]